MPRLCRVIASPPPLATHALYATRAACILPERRNSSPRIHSASSPAPTLRSAATAKRAPTNSRAAKGLVRCRLRVLCCARAAVLQVLCHSLLRGKSLPCPRHGTIGSAGVSLILMWQRRSKPHALHAGCSSAPGARGNKKRLLGVALPRATSSNGTCCRFVHGEN